MSTSPLTAADRGRAVAAVAASAASAPSLELFLTDALPRVQQVAGARGCAVISRVEQATVVQGQHGLQMPVEALERYVAGPVPTGRLPVGWTDDGTVLLHELPASSSWVVLIGASTTSPDDEVVAVLTMIDVGMARLDAQTKLTDLTHRVDNAQLLAQMGDYDWHITTDVNRWSDQLYRIYGHEPQSFNASYEQFISLLHPDDRERIQQVHQEAYATGGGYQMIERIVRPDGEVRYLASNGEVVTDDEGTPVRMRGTCIDITPTVEAERDREASIARFESLVESSPDAMILAAEDGRILQVNSRTSVLLGDVAEGQHLADVLGTAREDVMTLDAGSTVPSVIEVDGPDGAPMPLDVTLARLDAGTTEDRDQARFALFLRDARPRLASAALAMTLKEAEVSRRQALEINDNVVQGITAGLYALDQGNDRAARVYLERTLSAARKMMHDLLDALDGTDLEPGDLIRASPTVRDQTPVELAWAGPPPPAVGADVMTRRVLLADDSADVRLLLNCMLQTMSGYEVVGEAADGFEAVDQASALTPNLILLDLAMPRMDGLQALPLIRAVLPDVHIIVLSGFDGALLADKAIAAGADGYIEKGHAIADLALAIEQIVGTTIT